MTGPVFHFFLAVVLLAVDWAYDPYHGASPLSSRFSSQPCLQMDVGRRTTQAEFKRDSLDMAATAFNPVVSSLLAPSVLLPAAATMPDKTNLVYLFMIIQR